MKTTKFRDDCNSITQRVIRSLVEDTEDFDVTIGEEDISVVLSRIEQPDWKDPEKLGLDPDVDGSRPPVLHMRCRGTTTDTELSLRITSGGSRPVESGKKIPVFHLYLTAKEATEFGLIAISLSAYLGATKDGEEARLLAYADVDRKAATKGIQRDEALSEEVSKLVKAAGLKTITEKGRTNVVAGRIRVPDGTILPSAQEALKALVMTALIKYPYLAEETPSCWLFQANPSQYELSTELKKVRPGWRDNWTVTRYGKEMKPGDRVLMWQSGSEAGIYGVGTLVAEPIEREGANPFNPSSTHPWATVAFQFDALLNPPLKKKELVEREDLKNLQVIKQPPGTNFRVTPEEWKVISRMISESGQSVAKTSMETGTDFWKIAPGENAEEWEDWRKGEYIAIGWNDLGDLTGVDRDGFDERLQKALERNPNWSKAGVEQVWRFFNMLPGTRVVANKGTSRVLGIGTVKGLYRFDSSLPRQHVLPVRWDDLRERVVERGGWRKTLIQLKRSDFDEILNAPSPQDVDVSRTIPPPPPPGKIDFNGIVARLGDEGLSFPDELVASYLLALQTKRFVILSGISGTGKTQLALSVAKAFQPTEVETEQPEQEESGYRIEVQPYMLKYRRFVLPATVSVGLFTEETKGKGQRIDVSYGDGENISLALSMGPHAVQVLFSGAFREWFNDTFDEGDEFIVSVDEKEDGGEPVLTVTPADEVGTTKPVKKTWEIIAVRPDWTDNRGLLGYYNPITRQYQTTPFLRLLTEARREEEQARLQRRPPRPYFAILDEMNLARVEHYFSDFLSCLESGDSLHLHDDTTVEEGATETGEAVPMRLPIARNFFFTGTVNVDETTYMFSPKVLDRAFTLEFNEVDLAGFAAPGADDQDEQETIPLRLELFQGALDVRETPRAKDWEAFRELAGGALFKAVVALNDRLRRDQRHFGYRVANEMSRFVCLASEQAGKDDAVLWDALDVAVLSKVLPKLHGTQQELEEVIGRLMAFAVDVDAGPDATENEGGWRLVRDRVEPTTADFTRQPRLPRTAAKLWRMMRRLRLQGFASFIE